MFQNIGSTNDVNMNGVQCDVTNCYYNEQKSCTADEIKVGPQFAATSSDTICATFKPR